MVVQAAATMPSTLSSATSSVVVASEVASEDAPSPGARDVVVLPVVEDLDEDEDSKTLLLLLVWLLLTQRWRLCMAVLACDVFFGAAVERNGDALGAGG